MNYNLKIKMIHPARCATKHKGWKRNVFEEFAIKSPPGLSGGRKRVRISIVMAGILLVIGGILMFFLPFNQDKFITILMEMAIFIIGMVLIIMGSISAGTIYRIYERELKSQFKRMKNNEIYIIPGTIKTEKKRE
jgi:uncharacterized membrane protein HdeD (DUF308 family)